MSIRDITDNYEQLFQYSYSMDSAAIDLLMLSFSQCESIHCV